MRKAHIPNSANGTTQKGIVLDNLDDVIAKVSGDGEYRFNQRQLLYVLRPIVMDETGKELKIDNFTKIITDYESRARRDSLGCTASRAARSTIRTGTRPSRSAR